MCCHLVQYIPLSVEMMYSHFAKSILPVYIWQAMLHLCTVEPLNNRHIGTDITERLSSFAGKCITILYIGHCIVKCQKCPSFRVSFIRGFTVIICCTPQVVYAVKGCTLNSETPVPAIRELREKYTYNIYPCGLQSSGEIGTAGGKGTTTRPMAPLPSRGGSFATDESWKRAVRNNRQQKVKEPRSSECGSKRLQRAFGGGENAAISGPVDQQIKYLNKHYDTVAKQPTHVRCDMQVTPPIARAYCPQQQRDTNPIPYYTAYAADVPLDVIQQSRVMSGFDQLLKLHEHRRHKFMLSFSESPDSHNPLLARGGWREGGGGEGARELIHH